MADGATVARQRQVVSAEPRRDGGPLAGAYLAGGAPRETAGSIRSRLAPNARGAVERLDDPLTAFLRQCLEPKKALGPPRRDSPHVLSRHYALEQTRLHS